MELNRHGPEGLFRQKLELLLLTDDDEVLSRVKSIVSRYDLTFRQIAFSVLAYTPAKELSQAQLVLMTQMVDEDLSAFAERIDLVMRSIPRCRVLTVMSPKLSLDNLEGTHNPRVLPLSRNEFFNTLKLEYLCLCRCRTQYFMIPSKDLLPTTNTGFEVFIRLVLNKRYLLVLSENMNSSEARVHRLQQMSSIYILRKDAAKYAQYIKQHYSQNKEGAVKNFQAHFLELIQASLSLNEVLLFDFKSLSEEDMQAHYENLQRMCREIIGLLGRIEDPWSDIYGAPKGDFYRLWRSPWIALYAALISVKSGQGDPLVCMLSGLLTDIGVFDLKEEVSRQFLFSENRNVDADVSKTFVNHPIMSLNRCLMKKLPLNDEVKVVMTCTHERNDEKGFPNQVPSDNIPIESMFIQFAEKIDQAILSNAANKDLNSLRISIWESEKNSADVFSRSFLELIQAALN